MALPVENKRYTYVDYLTWPDDVRYELIEGMPYLMSPGPSQHHQSISMSLSVIIGSFLQGKPCQVFAAPFDVRLNPDGTDDTVVQPDLIVVCDRSKLDGKACVGAPDLVIEILSPSTKKHDSLTKFRLYLKAGVREYWIVDPDLKILFKYVLENGRYILHAFDETDTVAFHVLEGLELDLSEVFPEEDNEQTNGLQ